MTVQSVTFDDFSFTQLKKSKNLVVKIHSACLLDQTTAAFFLEVSRMQANVPAGLHLLLRGVKERNFTGKRNT